MLYQLSYASAVLRPLWGGAIKLRSLIFEASHAQSP